MEVLSSPLSDKRKLEQTKPDTLELRGEEKDVNFEVPSYSPV